MRLRLAGKLKQGLTLGKCTSGQERPIFFCLATVKLRNDVSERGVEGFEYGPHEAGMTLARV